MTENDRWKSALKRAMGLCARREICLSDIRQKMEAWGVEDNDKQKIISRLTGEKYIDEHRYAIAFVKDKFRYNKWGKVKIISALKLKNISGENIREAIDSIDEEVYLEVLKNIISNYRKNLKAKNLYDLKGKVFRHCISKGFESSLIYELLNLDQ